jgi:hypothetical protein
MNKTKMIYGPYGYVIGPADCIEKLANCQCSANSSDAKHKVTLLFDREALLYDIANVSYVEGDVMPTDDAHTKHQVFDITEDGNVDRVTRVLDLAHAICVEELYRFTKEPCEDDMQLDDLFKESDTYVIELNVSQKFSNTTAKLLEQLIHEYFVASALADWLSITNKNAAEKWAIKAQTLLDEAKRKVNMRTGVLTRPLRPF